MPDSAELARKQAAWLAAGTVPSISGLDSDMVAIALLDLHVLSGADGVPVAGWSQPWRYVWPRDSALVASALARTGHLADAERIVDFLQQVQPAVACFRPATCPMAVEYRMIAASSSTASAGRCGRLNRWRPS